MRRPGVAGSVGTEFLVTFTPLCLFFFSIWQEALMTTGQELTQHAALAAARSAAVVLTDDPKRYGGEAANTYGTKRTDAVKAAAVRAMAPFVFDETIEDVKVTFPNGQGTVTPGQDIAVRVTATFRCNVPMMASILCGSGGTTELTADSTFPAQAARFTYSR
ncbi:MAG: hypothetical protein JWP97_160 [Labilithrix sp.]|nr:hypothetical protein [Labilithrix sp.]